jgi:hypothetical protein
VLQLMKLNRCASERSLNRKWRVDVRVRNVRTLARKRASPDELGSATTDLSTLQQRIVGLTDLWEWEVTDYAAGTSQLRLTEAQHAAYVYFRAVSALAKFDAAYVPVRIAIERNFDLALRLSGLTRAQLEEIAAQSE